MTIKRKSHPDHPYSSFAPPKEIKLKRTELKRTAFKRQRKPDDRKLDRIRAKWRTQFERCHICQKRKPQHTHEIRGGLWRHITVAIKAFWLGVCWKCHRRIHDTDEYPWARQLAIKQQCDPGGYDLELYNATLTDEIPITQSEVDKWL